MQLSRPLLYSPFFSPEDCFFREDFLIFCSKRPLFLCLAVFFSWLLFFFVLMMMWCGVFFFFLPFFSLFTLLFFRFGGFHFDNTGERRKKQMRRYNRMERVMRERVETISER